MKKLTRERVVPIISASVSWLIFGTREEIVFEGRGSDPFCTVLRERVSESVWVSKGKICPPH
jgi:hypothetical protein